MKFYVGLHQRSDAKHFRRCMISVARLRERRSNFSVGEWMLDSGAFTEIRDHGRHRLTPEAYARQIRRWWQCGFLIAASPQDWMCEPFILARTGLTVEEHQRRTTESYRQLRELVGPMVYMLPVLQGYWPKEYVAHVRQYGELLAPNAWTGVGSVCKRNVHVEEIERVLMAIHRARPDLRLHGFGVKLTALRSSVVRQCLWSADSMAWSKHARMHGRNGNDWREAARFVRKIESQEVESREFQNELF